MSDVLFHRDYQGFSGGHLKVWHYFQHVTRSDRFVPQVFFTATSAWDATNPWSGARLRVVSGWAPERADILFLAGEDWQALSPEERLKFPRPIVNLVQGVRHADPALTLRQHLANRAIRICVSGEVEEAILATGIVNGPTFTIPNGLDLDSLPEPPRVRDIGVLIAGVKNQAMARQLEAALGGARVCCLTQAVPRDQFLSALARSEIAVLLPLAEEGFYLPALEAMALGALVVCPDCVGNRSFCLDGVNAFRTRYDLPAILEAVEFAGALDTARQAALRAAALETSRQHDLAEEYRRFLEILENAEDLWRSGNGGAL